MINTVFLQICSLAAVIAEFSLLNFVNTFSQFILHFDTNDWSYSAIFKLFTLYGFCKQNKLI